MQKDKQLTFVGSTILMAANIVGRWGVNPKEAERFIKFMAVGLIGFAVDFTIFNLLRVITVQIFPTEPYQTRAITVIAGISLFAAITNNFLWNRYWTYPDSRSKPFWRQYGQFALVNSSGFFVLRAPIIFFTRGWFQSIILALDVLQPNQAMAVGDNAALACAVFIVMFWNFFVNRYWTFNDVSS